MGVYILPMYEYQRGWYEIEADSLEEAQAIVEQGDFTETLEPQYRDGRTEWYPEEMYEEKEGN